MRFFFIDSMLTELHMKTPENCRRNPFIEIDYDNGEKWVCVTIDLNAYGMGDSLLLLPHSFLAVLLVFSLVFRNATEFELILDSQCVTLRIFCVCFSWVRTFFSLRRACDLNYFHLRLNCLKYNWILKKKSSHRLQFIWIKTVLQNFFFARCDTISVNFQSA